MQISANKYHRYTSQEVPVQLENCDYKVKQRLNSLFLLTFARA